MRLRTHSTHILTLACKRPIYRRLQPSPASLPTNHTHRLHSSHRPHCRQPPPPHPNSHALPSSALPIRSLVALALPLLGYATYLFSAPAPTLNTSTFTPFTLIHHARISSTSSILTLRPVHAPPPSDSASDTDPYAPLWTSSTWSLELKHPSLTISRLYTPLPPSLLPSRSSALASEAAGLPAPQAGDVRLLVRKYDTGEVSRYLHHLNVGDTVEVRGGFRGFEVPGECKRVLFLAGGTGVAPAVQVAGVLARRGMQGGIGGAEEGEGGEMRLLWANRRREDVGGLSTRTGTEVQKQGAENGNGNAMTEMLSDLSLKASQLSSVDFRTTYFVDEDDEFIQAKHLVEAMNSFTKIPAPFTPSPSGKQDDVALRRQNDTGSSTSTRHEKVILVSGPDGFVEYFAGPRMLRDGVEVQGVTGGLLAQMRLEGWTVVRL